MKKSLIIGGLAALVVVAGVIWWLVAKPGQQTQTGNANSTGKTYAAKEACDILTQAIANQTLGDGAELGLGNNNTASDDVNVSTCAYSAKTDGTVAGAKNMKLATLMVRSPLSAIGAESNKEPFASPKANTQNVDGYGEKAFWDSEFGQLNVLKNDTWLILSFGVTGQTGRTLDETKLFADKIVPNFN